MMAENEAPQRYGKMQRTFQESMAVTLSFRDTQEALLNRVMQVDGLPMVEAFTKILMKITPGSFMKLRSQYLCLFLDGEPVPNADEKWIAALDEAIALAKEYA